MPAWGIFKPKVRQSISGRSLKNKDYKFNFFDKVQKILKGNLDLIPSPSP